MSKRREVGKMLQSMVYCRVEVVVGCCKGRNR